MAVSGLGATGTYKCTTSGYNRDSELRKTSDIVWVTKRYDTKDLRVTAPVPRHKLYVIELPLAESHWISPKDASPWSYFRAHEEASKFASSPSTRCEEWSTLREMLPSRGSSAPSERPNWGTGHSESPYLTTGKQTRFPHMNSPMTR